MEIKKITLNVTLYEKGNNYCMLIENKSQTTDKITYVVINNGHFFCEEKEKNDAINQITFILSMDLPEDEHLTLSQRCAIMRKARGLTQSELAKMIGKHQEEISRFENYKSDFQISFLGKIEKALNCKIKL